MTRLAKRYTPLTNGYLNERRGSMGDAAVGRVLSRGRDRIVEKSKDPFFEQFG